MMKHKSSIRLTPLQSSIILALSSGMLILSDDYGWAGSPINLDYSLVKNNLPGTPGDQRILYRTFKMLLDHGLIKKVKTRRTKFFDGYDCDNRKMYSIVTNVYYSLSANGKKLPIVRKAVEATKKLAA